MSENTIPHNRLALQYFPDAEHYREQDFQTWLPVLRALGAGWLVLQAPASRAIPEPFVRGLVKAGIQPVLQFGLSPVRPPAAGELTALLNAYRTWGVHYVALFDRPNLRETWDGVSWARQDLVANFLTLYIPLAEAVQEAGLTNVLPPLEPGGDYWDTAFLRAALNGLNERARGLLDDMVIGLYAWADNLPLDWGAGGPERWPATKPYYTPPGEEDQRGFRNFDWVATNGEAALARRLPMLALGGGSRLSRQHPEHPPLDADNQAEATLHMLALLDGQDAAGLPPLPEGILACSLGVLAAEPGHPAAADAWFPPGGKPLPVAAAVKAAKAGRAPRAAAAKGLPDEGRHQPDGLRGESLAEAKTVPAPASEPEMPPTAEPKGQSSGTHSPNGDGRIRHYVLLPTYEWGVADWHLEVIRPFVKRHLATVGFSLAEAATSAKVTVVGGAQSFPPAALDGLRAAGCEVVQLSGDGTSIASQLETL